MKVIDTENLVGGWFVGNFEPTTYKTEFCEVSYRCHRAEETPSAHYHRYCDEINYLVSGKMEINGQLVESPCVFIIDANEIIHPIFLTDAVIIVVKISTRPDNKMIVNDKVIITR